MMQVVSRFVVKRCADIGTDANGKPLVICTAQRSVLMGTDCETGKFVYSPATVDNETISKLFPYRVEMTEQEHSLYDNDEIETFMFAGLDNDPNFMAVFNKLNTQQREAA